MDKEAIRKDQLLVEALRALKINVPVMHSEVKGNVIKLWLYGQTHAKPTIWRKKGKRKRRPKAKSNGWAGFGKEN